MAGTDFERARHGDDVPGGPGLVERLGGACKQRIGDIVVEPRLDHEDARARGLRLFAAAVFASARPLIPHCWPRGSKMTVAGTSALAASPSTALHSAPSGRFRDSASSPACAAPSVVTDSVCGMISTENVSAVDLVDGQRDAVERDRALGRDEARQLRARAASAAPCRSGPRARQARQRRRHGRRRYARRARRRLSARVRD